MADDLRAETDDWVDELVSGPEAESIKTAIAGRDRELETVRNRLAEVEKDLQCAIKRCPGCWHCRGDYYVDDRDSVDALAAAEQRGREQQRAADVEALRNGFTAYGRWWLEYAEDREHLESGGALPEPFYAAQFVSIALFVAALPLASGSPEGPQA
jgi:hypothetical protein